MNKSTVPQTPNTSWALKLDSTNTWAYWEQVFTPEECQKIIEIGESRIMTSGVTIGGNTNTIRKCDISWLYSVDDMEWAFKRVTDIVISLNERFFGFDLHGMNEGFQFTRYTAPGECYGKHVDKIYGGIIRKLSISIQLDTPDKYEGGDLLLYEDETPIKISREQGYLSAFPSYLMHEVTPVTKGTRHSLVTWVTGAPFK